ncbi:MAG: Prophage protein [Parcubacteria group bacterium GW2011_GWB1_49_7]|nr:MAG: Prophage protein [Parcubacteria group bacterium GW2011_GWA1_47_10]KKW09680.1 MAG: Prophage protein [Parcubacteria group bacterium GW2011_GWB1_49_7]
MGYNYYMDILKAKDVASFLIDLSLKEGADKGLPTPEGITNLKLQKLLYFAQASHMALFNKPLFTEKIEAWKWGPVIPSIYHHYSSNKNKPLPLDKSFKGIDNDKKSEFIKGVWDLFGKYSAIELMKITHKHKPWIEAFQKGSGTTIENSVLRSYYKNLFTLANE